MKTPFFSNSFQSTQLNLGFLPRTFANTVTLSTLLAAYPITSPALQEYEGTLQTSPLTVICL